MEYSIYYAIFHCLAQSYDFTSFVYFVLFFSCQIHLQDTVYA